MSINRKKYDEEFKKRAVRMSYSSERPVTAVAESLGVTSNMIYRWRKKYTPDGEKTQLTQQQDELSELRKRIAELEEENYILKKSVGLLREKSEVKTTDFYELMKNETKYAKTKWAEKLGVSTSGFYTWLHDRNRRKASDDALRKKVISVFDDGQGVYGADRICGILRRNGASASYPVVKRIMSQEDLKSCHCRRRQRPLTDSRKAHGDEYKNLTKGLEIERPFQVLSSDISYIRTGEGFDYLCQIRDVMTNTVLASCQAENMKKKLVLKTLKAAQDRWHLPSDVIFHSDRGSQYTSAEVMAQVAAYGWKQSFSAVGKPGDNAWSESFFSILKKEIIHWRFHPTREAARQAIFEYIEGFCNRHRVQKRLGYLSPIQFLSTWNKRALPCSA